MFVIFSLYNQYEIDIFGTAKAQVYPRMLIVQRFFIWRWINPNLLGLSRPKASEGELQIQMASLYDVKASLSLIIKGRTNFFTSNVYAKSKCKITSLEGSLAEEVI